MMPDNRNSYDLQGSADVDAMTVSVVVAAHNAADTIAETLMSALHQTHPTFEILVVDDASKDATAEIVQAVAARDPRVRLIRLEQNRGVSGARNAGIREARGDYVAPLDADDLWRPEKLSRQLQRFQTAGPRTGLVYSWWHYVDVMGDLMPGRYGAFSYEGDVYARLLMANFVGPSSVPLIRRGLLHEAGLYNERLSTHEDKALHLALAEICDFAVVPECLVGYRARPGSLSHKLGQLEACDSIVHAHAGMAVPAGGRQFPLVGGVPPSA
jgi:glycosyltransferase involved in cell wall biosynthesis